MVGHIPLEDVILVRVQVWQQLKNTFYMWFLIAARSEVSAYFTSWTRKPFPCECTREWKRCTEAVSFEKCTHGPSLAARTF